MASRSPPLQHTFFSEMKPIKEIELELNVLMKEFEEGKMQAFSDPDTMSRMDRIRQMQERLAQKHFHLDESPQSGEEKREEFHHDPSHTDELMQELDALTTEIQQLKPVSMLENIIPLSSSSLLNTPKLPKSPSSPLTNSVERVFEPSPTQSPDTFRVASVLTNTHTLDSAP
ncbi:Coiled-coil domain-containing protein 28B-like [Oopsacas minuta]|uniref:Coiled-coil domain-containing protein 28B-like n=1 Tax=Oopsacas minuta TaxID=111878 RepID=A0AAV7JTX7_9METZ|nr:Coiled-coil domain-containing protein 28B-like [Oopsacas minuta]